MRSIVLTAIILETVFLVCSNAKAASSESDRLSAQLFHLRVNKLPRVALTHV
jgi:hypothetical protein